MRGTQAAECYVGMVMRLRILLVDDDASVLRALRRYLQAAGHEVVTAACGRDGLSLAYLERPHAASGSTSGGT